MTLGASNCPEQSPIVKLVLELRLQNGEILRQLGAMQQDIRNLSFNLSQMKASMSAAPPSPEMAPEPSRAPLPKLPAATMEEFRELENALKDKATATALQLEVATWVRATDTVAEACRSLLERALKKEVQIKFSLLGRKGKLPFRGTLLCHIVTETIKSAKAANVPDVEKAIGKYLAGAVDREGGRRERFCRQTELYIILPNIGKSLAAKGYQCKCGKLLNHGARRKARPIFVVAWRKRPSDIWLPFRQRLAANFNVVGKTYLG
ncbi:uncharacterized protein LOC120844602 [Ixodes scapularis]|uniref:uncharacterized protein LOC120844602 n=1 Tax=Ixodes scapularis TaxID=6945 RepID=UPI001A9F7015|nr:uncharacterized protein LOC120844602 [Ixodes scapularis]